MSERPDGAGSITVITLTRRRPMLVQRAMRSVQGQQTSHTVNHVVLIDDCPDTRAALEAVSGQYPNAEVLYMPREAHEVSGPGRSSRLRNFGVRRSADSWIAFLDDDNEWTADHLQNLVECAREHGVRAAHSYVSLLNRDGSSYLEPRWPWARSGTEAEQIYLDYVAKGICAPGSNVIRDRPGIYDEPVDSSAWLLSRELLLEVPFEERFSQRDAENLVGEDDKLFRALVGKGEPMACTRQATLRYYLGGYSNSASGKTDETFSWATEHEAR
jgi:glycosyltransferase involved in cell wall biosynthesis